MKFLLILMLSLSSVGAFANGVERGKVNYESTVGGYLSQGIKTALDLLLIQSKKFPEDTIVQVVTAQVSSTQSDMDMEVRYYRIKFIAISAYGDVEVFEMEIAEHFVSNPPKQNVEVRAIRSLGTYGSY